MCWWCVCVCVFGLRDGILTKTMELFEEKDSESEREGEAKRD